MQGFWLHLCVLRNEVTDNLPPSAKGSMDDSSQGSQASPYIRPCQGKYYRKLEGLSLKEKQAPPRVCETPVLRPSTITCCPTWHSNAENNTLVPKHVPGSGHISKYLNHLQQLGRLHAGALAFLNALNWTQRLEQVERIWHGVKQKTQAIACD